MQSLRGKLAWNEVIEPSVLLARNGFIVSRELAYEIAKHSEYEQKIGPVNGGEIFQRPILANTLELIAQHGADGLLYEVLNLIKQKYINFLNQVF